MQENSALENENNIKRSAKKPILSTKSKKIGKVFYKVFSSFLVLILVCVPLFTFTACVDNGTFYVGIMTKKNTNIAGGGQSTTPSEDFLEDMTALSQTLLREISNSLGVASSVPNISVEVPFADYLDIRYELSEEGLRGIYQEFSLFNYFTYCEYSNANTLVLSNYPLNKSQIETYVINYDEQNGVFTNSYSETITPISGDVSYSQALPYPYTELETNSVYRYAGEIDSHEVRAYVFIGNRIGLYYFNQTRFVSAFLQKFYDSSYALIEHTVYIPSNFTVNQPMDMRTYSWAYSLLSVSYDLEDFYSPFLPKNYQTEFVNYYYKDLSVFICLYLITGGTDPTALEDFVDRDFSMAGATLYYYYEACSQFIGRGESIDANRGWQSRDYFVRVCCQYIGTATINSDEDSEGEFTNTVNAIIQELLGSSYYNERLIQDKVSVISDKIKEIVSENNTGDSSSEIIGVTSTSQISPIFAYNNKEGDVHYYNTNGVLMQNREPVQAIIFEAYGRSDVLDYCIIDFDYYDEGATPEETESNKQAGLQILNDYVFTIRYSVRVSIDSEPVALNKVIDKEKYISERDLEQGLLFIDLQSIYREYFKETFDEYIGQDSFYLANLETEGLYHEPFRGQVKKIDFRNSSMGFGSYYNGRIESEAGGNVLEYYLEIIFGAPSGNKILNLRINDIYL